MDGNKIKFVSKWLEGEATGFWGITALVLIAIIICTAYVLTHGKG